MTSATRSHFALLTQQARFCDLSGKIVLAVRPVTYEAYDGALHPVEAGPVEVVLVQFLVVRSFTLAGKHFEGLFLG